MQVQETYREEEQLKGKPGDLFDHIRICERVRPAAGASHRRRTTHHRGRTRGQRAGGRQRPPQLSPAAFRHSTNEQRSAYLIRLASEQRVWLHRL